MRQKFYLKLAIKDKKIIKNNSFSDFDYSNDDEIKVLIGKLKIIYRIYGKITIK